MRDHVEATLRQLGFRYGADFVEARGQVVVTDRDAIRALVEQRDMIVVAGLHVGLVADPDGRARAALVTLGAPGFFHVIMDETGRPVAEQPLTLDVDANTPIAAPVEEDAPRPTYGAGGAPEEEDLGDGRESQEMGREGVESGAPAPAPVERERERASAREATIIVSTSRRLIAVMLEGTIPAEVSKDPLVTILSPLAGMKGRAVINLPGPALALRLGNEANKVFQEESHEWDLRDAAGRLMGELHNVLAQTSNLPEREVNHEPPLQEAKEDAIMAKGAQAKKKAGKKGGKTTAKKQEQTKTASESTRRKVTEDIVQQAIDMREEGATWGEVQDATGFNGAQLRPHMAKMQGVEITVAKTAKAIAKAREEGHAWYAIAAATGLSVAEVKEKAEEGGASVEGRVYKESDKDDDSGSTKKKGKAGKKRGRKAKEDPSDED